MTDTPDALKLQAKRLAAYLKTHYGWSLPPAGSLEAIAASHGYRDWNTCVACAAPGGTPDRSAAVVSTVASFTPAFGAGNSSRFSDLFAQDAAPTMEQFVAVALAEGIEDIHLPACPSAAAANLVHVRSRDAFRLPLLVTDRQLSDFVRTVTGSPSVAVDGTTEGRWCLTVAGRDVFVEWTRLGKQSGQVLVIRVKPESSFAGLFENDDFARSVQDRAGWLFVVAGLTGHGKTVSVRTLASRLAKQGKRVAYAHDSEMPPVIGAVSFAVDTHLTKTLETVLDYAQQTPVTHLVLNGSLKSSTEAVLVLQALDRGITVVTEAHGQALRHVCEWPGGMFGFIGDSLTAKLGGVRSQELLPKTCAECAGYGCAACGNRGANGKVLAFENILFNETHTAAAALEGDVYWTPLAEHVRQLTESGLAQPRNRPTAPKPRPGSGRQ